MKVNRHEIEVSVNKDITLTLTVKEAEELYELLGKELGKNTFTLPTIPSIPQAPIMPHYSPPKPSLDEWKITCQQKD